MKAMKVALGTFEKEGIEIDLGGDIASGVRTALLRYLDRLGSAKPPLAPPRFRDAVASGDAGATRIELDLSEEAQVALEREARRHAVPVDRILSHAVLVYLAELDAAGAITFHLPPNP
jgi:hypothetical protein